MPIIRNPFARRAGAPPVNDESLRPGAATAIGSNLGLPGFERVDTVGSKASSALSIRSTKSHDTGEYKMSVVNDSGVYLPPSPIEQDFWPRRYLSRTSTDTRSASGSDLGEIEHFSITRESFDSYRRSFDICAKSPVVVLDTLPARSSLDSARLPRLPRSALNERRFEREPPTPEEGFEEVGLNDEEAVVFNDYNKPPQLPPAPRKRGFFRFGSEHTDDGPTHASGAQTTRSRFLSGRKRGQSSQGSELGPMPTGAEQPTAPTSSAFQEQEMAVMRT